MKGEFILPLEQSSIGYIINPALDLEPRIVDAILPVKASSDLF